MRKLKGRFGLCESAPLWLPLGLHASLALVSSRLQQQRASVITRVINDSGPRLRRTTPEQLRPEEEQTGTESEEEERGEDVGSKLKTAETRTEGQTSSRTNHRTQL